MIFSETPSAIKATAVADAATSESVLSIAVIILMSAIENIKATKTDIKNSVEEIFGGKFGEANEILIEEFPSNEDFIDTKEKIEKI